MFSLDGVGLQIMFFLLLFCSFLGVCVCGWVCVCFFIFRLSLYTEYISILCVAFCVVFLYLLKVCGWICLIETKPSIKSHTSTRHIFRRIISF